MENLSTILEASYQPQQEAEATLSKLGYKYDPELSSMNTKVFFDPERNEPHIAYRGSIRATDWIDNARLALLGKSKQKDEAIQTALKVKEKYGKSPTTYGHSRGGYLSEVAGEATGGKAFTYNKATFPSQVSKVIRPEQTDIREVKDIVSLPSVFQKATNKITLQTPFYVPTIASHGLSGLKRSNLSKLKFY
jgi:hypothetical protein